MQEALTNAKLPGAVTTAITIHWGEGRSAVVGFRTAWFPLPRLGTLPALGTRGSGNGLRGMSEPSPSTTAPSPTVCSPDGGRLVEAALPYRDL